METLVLDTNAFAEAPFRHWLKDFRGGKVLPVVAYVETGVHWLNVGRSLEELDALLAGLRVEVEWIHRGQGKIAAQTGHQMKDFSKNARDHLSGSHAMASNRYLITRNQGDFTFLGSRVLTPEAAMSRFGSQARP
ncbi:MAG: type II toxin-antitoxin system VapC family toxin [Thermoplasmatota archaeon]